MFAALSTPVCLGVLGASTELTLLFALGLSLLVAAAVAWLTVTYIPHDRVGIVEKFWSKQGSLPEGRIVALNDEAGYQADLLRGGLHFGYFKWQYRIHKARLVTVPQGKIGYVYARDGDSLPPSQTLGRVVDCNNFQDARAFLQAEGEAPRGQRGRQRAILREGVYAINQAMFVVMTMDMVFALRHLQGTEELQSIYTWQEELTKSDGFSPVVIGGPVSAIDPLHPEKNMEVDGIGIVTVHDGPSLPPGEIIAPAVGTEPTDPNYHNNFQDPEAFLR